MSTKNRARRAGKNNQRDPGSAPGADAGGWYRAPEGEPSLPERARLLVAEAVRAVLAQPREEVGLAAALSSPDCPVPPELTARALDAVLAEVIAATTRGGWSPLDLGEIVRRRATERHLPLLAALLTQQIHRCRADLVSAPWRQQVSDLGWAHAIPTATAAGMELALGLAAALGFLPVIGVVLDPPGARDQTPSSGRQSDNRSRDAESSTDAKVFARVRALLAKAESTEFPEEAEALSGKAQELVSRYALEHLLDRADEHAGSEPVLARRLWIDAPYVMAKGMLVSAVAQANRARAITHEDLGFITVVGERADLDAIELLATSLLVQANAAMLSHGRHQTRYGSRTASFRRAFLIAYAGRIHERLMSAAEHATEQAGADGGRGAELVPLLTAKSERVDDAMTELFPNVVTRQTTISNRDGYAAGRAAADRARFSPGDAVEQSA